MVLNWHTLHMYMLWLNVLEVRRVLLISLRNWCKKLSVSMRVFYTQKKKHTHEISWQMKRDSGSAFGMHVTGKNPHCKLYISISITCSWDMWALRFFFRIHAIFWQVSVEKWMKSTIVEIIQVCFYFGMVVLRYTTVWILNNVSQNQV